MPGVLFRSPQEFQHAVGSCGAMDLRGQELSFSGLDTSSKMTACLRLLTERGLGGADAFCIRDCCLLEVAHLEALAVALGGRNKNDVKVPGADDENPSVDDDGFGDGFALDIFDKPFETDVESGLTPALTEVPAEAGSASLATTPVEDKQGALRSFTLAGCGSESGPPTDSWSRFWHVLPLTLRRLELRKNWLSDRAVSSLCRAFSEPPACLEELSLGGNNCKDIDRLCRLVCCGSLVELDLSSNHLNDKSLVQLCDALTHSSTALRALDLSWNPRFSSAGILKLAEQLPKTRLHTLCIAGTALCDVGAEALATSLPFCSSFETLCADRTRITDVGARQLLAAARVTHCVRLIVVDEGGEPLRWHRCGPPDIPDCLSKGLVVEAGPYMRCSSPVTK